MDCLSCLENVLVCDVSEYGLYKKCIFFIRSNHNNKKNCLHIKQHNKYKKQNKWELLMYEREDLNEFETCKCKCQKT